MLPRSNFSSDEEYLTALRDWFKGQALANPAICTGEVPHVSYLNDWFGPNRTGITRWEIIAKQAEAAADALLEARK